MASSGWRPDPALSSDDSDDDPPPPTVHKVVDAAVLNEIPTRDRGTTAKQRWGMIMKEAQHVAKAPISTVQWLFSQLRSNKEERSEIDLLKSLGLRRSATDDQEQQSGFEPAPPPLPPRPANLTPANRRRPPVPPKTKKPWLGRPQTMPVASTTAPAGPSSMMIDEEDGSQFSGSDDETPASSVPTTEGSMFEENTSNSLPPPPSRPLPPAPTTHASASTTASGGGGGGGGTNDYDHEDVDEVHSMRLRVQAIEEMKAATEIFTLYVKRGALRELGLPQSIRANLEAAIERGQVSRTMFDEAQKHIVVILRTDVLPKYMEYMGGSAGGTSSVITNEERLTSILSDEHQTTAFVDFCTSMYTEENVLFYLAVEKFRVANLGAPDTDDQSFIAGARVSTILEHEAPTTTISSSTTTTTTQRTPPPRPPPPRPPVPSPPLPTTPPPTTATSATLPVKTMSAATATTTAVVAAKKTMSSEAELLERAKAQRLANMLKWPTLKQLVVKMISASHENVEFRNSFLLTMHYFSSPPEVLDILFALLQAPPPDRPAAVAPSTLQTTFHISKSRDALTVPELTAWKASKIRIFSVLKHWVKMYHSDFEPVFMEQRLRNTLRQFPPLEWSHYGYNTGTLKLIAQSVLDSLEHTRMSHIKKRQPKRSSRQSYANASPYSGAGGAGSPSAHHGPSESREHWIPDQVTNACMVCWSAFTFINRRHHCRNCGILVCGSCSSNSAEVEDNNDGDDRNNNNNNNSNNSRRRNNNGGSGGRNSQDGSPRNNKNKLTDLKEQTVKLLRMGKKKKVRVCDNCYDIITGESGGAGGGRSSSTAGMSMTNSNSNSSLSPMKKQSSKVLLQPSADRATAMHNVLAKSLQENRSVDLLKLSAQEMAFQLTLVAKRRMQDINGARDFMKVSDKWAEAYDDGNNGVGGSSASRTPPSVSSLPPSSSSSSQQPIASSSTPQTSTKGGRVANMLKAFEQKQQHTSSAPPPLAPSANSSSSSSSLSPAAARQQVITAQPSNSFSRLTTVHDSISLAIDRTVDRLRPVGEANAGDATVSMDTDLFTNIKNKAQRQWQMRMSNQMSCWVASEILNTREELRQRMFQRWIKVANICYELRNFNTLFEIMTGLSHNSVYRLRDLIEALPRSMHDTYEHLCKIVHYNNNYAVYRLEVAEAASHGKSVIPYLGVMLRDLVAIEEGGDMYHKEYIPIADVNDDLDYVDEKARAAGKVVRKYVNFTKLQLMARLVSDTLSCQHTRYEEVKPDTNLQLRLLAGMIQALDEDELNEASYRIKEPKFKSKPQRTNTQ